MSVFEILRYNTPINLIGGGDIGIYARKIFGKNGYPYIGVDRGYRAMKQMQICPDAIIGDMDSVDVQENWSFPVLQSNDQNTTDFEKALQIIKAPAILCFGFLGGRIDHSLASFNAISKFRDRPALIFGEYDFAFLCPQELKLNLPKHTAFSLFPMGETQARSDGLAWSVNDIPLSPYGRISTSNYTVDRDIVIKIDKGSALIILPHKVLDYVLKQLFYN